jgi:two-component system, chemotaxis family, CheB/CheR fusion protein
MDDVVIPSSTHPFHIVGIGASAGGLDAFLELFGAVPSDTGMAFVVIQHLEPHSESQLAEILSRSTTMPVVQAQEGQSVEHNHVYVIPPNRVMIIQGGTLHLGPRPESAVLNYAVDTFFESLATDQGANAIGVVLSGSASDGAQGIRAIKAKCGITFAQDERTAKYGGMPHSAAATGAVDFVLPPARIAEELARIDSHPYLATPPEQLEEPLSAAEEDDEFRSVLNRLEAASHVDFSQYKQSTIRRRLGRRLALHHLDTLREYLDYSDTHPAEIHDLYRDILISVTSFFREPEMFEALAKATNQYLMNRQDTDAFRIWVPGCATGEEAYSLAIMMFEILRKSGKEFPIQVFGTDISDVAIDRARSGVYPEKAAQDLLPERLQAFFTRVDSGYRIKPQIRDCCIFARHDLAIDPPFSQIDLVSCRNVFIYLSPVLQQRVLPALHYSLKPEGLLILGSAETVGSRTDLFGILDHENKIYVKKGVASAFRPSGIPPVHVPAPSAPAPARRVFPIPTLLDLEAKGARILRDLYAPAGVIVNDDLQILHVHGQTAAYLAGIPAETSVNLLRVAREELVTPLRRAVASALEKKQPVQQSGIQVNYDGQTREINISVIPLSDDTHCCLVLFEDEAQGGISAPARDVSQEPNPAEVQLSYAQRELAQTRDYLRQVVEQHDAATEELRAANEEARSSNEELQSTNEELRTAKEQLQSANEELITVNDELERRNRDLSVASNDLTNVLNAATVPIVMVDMNQRLRRFTPAAERLLSLGTGDVGRRIIETQYSVRIPGLEEMLTETIRTLEVQRRRVEDREGRLYELFVRPYRTLDERIEGAVMTFIDVNETVRALEREEASRRFADAIVETVQHPLLVLDSNLRVLRATGAFYQTFDVRPEDTLGKPIDSLGNGQWNIPELLRLLEEALVRDVPFRNFEVTHQFPEVGKKVMRLNARRVLDNGANHRLLLAIEDVTERREVAEIQYRRLFESARDGILVLNPSGTVVDVNPYFLELFRLPEAELLNKPFQSISPFGDTEQMRRLAPEALEQSQVRYDQVRLRRRDGVEIIADMIANSYKIKGQAFIQVNIRDVTERTRNEQRLRSVNLDLQQFAFAASHDLQEPLRTIISHLELLKGNLQDKLGAEAEQHAGFVLAAADRMRQLVLDLLGYSQAAHAELRLAPVNAEAVLSTVLMNLQLAIQSTDARITFDPLPTIYMDGTQLTQLLQNLISNALKYRGEQPPQIHISAREEGGEWVFSVQDNGLGLDMRYAEQIFGIFKRLHGRKYPGTGIGLAVCKKIVERRGGRIWIESKPGEGSTFFFTLPINPKQD